LAKEKIMRRAMVLAITALTAGGAIAQTAGKPTGAPNGETVAAGQSDPFQWLEEVQGERAIAWAREQNTRTLSDLQSDPRYQRYHDAALQILEAQDRIPFVSMRPDGLYNFWQDANHVRGLWRRTTMASYRTDTPRWETVLDIDALSKAENANWVWRGGNCLPPNYRRCLVNLSDGGKDASVVREFDTVSKTFVPGGFSLPEGKQTATWLDENTLLVARDWGAGTMTRSGYPFVVKRLSRGQKLEAATEVFRGTAEDVSAGPMVIRDNKGKVQAVGFSRGVNFFEREYSVMVGDRLVKLPLPAKAAPIGLVDGRLLVQVNEPWNAGPGLTFRPDTVVSYDLAEWKRDPLTARPSLVWTPGARQTLSGVAATANKLIVTTLDNVRGRAVTMDYEKGRWRTTPIALPRNATLGLAAASDITDEAMFSVTDYLTPSTLWYFNAANGALETLKRSPARFDASGHLIEQFEARSKDGTSIPYFVVRPKTARMDGSTPTLLYGYGGFQVPMVPSYLGSTGKLWLEQGGAYVVANLRGGGEFGPEWHQTAQGANSSAPGTIHRGRGGPSPPQAHQPATARSRRREPRRAARRDCDHPASGPVQRRHRSGSAV
jgi:prolyl oligopeptidase